MADIAGVGETAKPTTSAEHRSAERFISETVDDALKQRLDDMHISTKAAEQILGEINRLGQTPEDALVGMMQKNRVVAIGEAHNTYNPQRDVGAEMMSELQRNGATHLAIEADAKIQPILNCYMETGRLDPQDLPNLVRDNNYIQMLENARTSGLKIVAVDDRIPPKLDFTCRPSESDTPSAPDEDRNKAMAENIKNILDSDPRNKVVFWVGSMHLYHSHDPANLTAADRLRETTTIATSNAIYQNYRNRSVYPLPEITNGLKVPVAISTFDAKTLGDLHYYKTESSDEPRQERDWDYIFAYPNK